MILKQNALFVAMVGLFQWRIKVDLCRVYTCRFDNQVPNEKLVKKHFCVVKVTRCIVCKEDRKPPLDCRYEIWVLKLGNLFSQTSGFVSGCQNR